MIENSVGTIMKSLQNDLQIYVSNNNINEEDFLVHRELLKKVHFEIRVKEVIPKPVFQTEIVYFLYDFNAIHRNKLKKLHDDLDWNLNYTYCHNEMCQFDHYFDEGSQFNVLNEASVEGEVFGTTLNYCCRYCYSYDYSETSDSFRKLFRHCRERGREIIRERKDRGNKKNSVQFYNFRYYFGNSDILFEE